jgi:hemoglobin-like flavoprotein
MVTADFNMDVKAAIEDLGKRHLSYGVKRGHYRAFGEAFMWAIEQALGERFTPEVKEAWEALYRLLAELMTEAAYE